MENEGKNAALGLICINQASAGSNILSTTTTAKAVSCCSQDGNNGG